MSENSQMIFYNVIISFIIIIGYFLLTIFLLSIREEYFCALVFVDILLLLLSPLIFTVIHAVQKVFKTTNKYINIILWVLVLLPFSRICIISFTLPFLDLIVNVLL
jgi:hypothetical protein